jgi:Sulfotransferase domain
MPISLAFMKAQRSIPGARSAARLLRRLPYIGAYVDSLLAHFRERKGTDHSQVAVNDDSVECPPRISSVPEDQYQQQSEAKPLKPILILGHDETTVDLLKILPLFGFRPVAIHSLPGGISEGSAIEISRQEIEAATGASEASIVNDNLSLPAVSAEDFCRMANGDKLPILIGSYIVRERDQFRDAIFYGRNKLHLKSAIWHPVRFADHFRFAEKRFQIIAFPGSGNMLVQSIFSRLAKVGLTNEALNNDPVSTQISRYSYHYYFSLYNFISSQFDLLGRWRADNSPSHTRYGAIYVPIGDEKAPIVIGGLPQRAYTWAGHWNGSHEPLVEETLRFFTNQNFQIVQILRHPLDLIVSNAAKITSFAGHREPSRLIGDREWMMSMIEILEAYFRGLREFRSSVTCIRYESLLANPMQILKEFAEAIGAMVTEEDITRIWEDLSGRTLSNDPGHRWDPRPGKWMEYIPERYADIIMSSRLRDYAKILGYEIERDMFKGDDHAPDIELCSELHLAWQDARWESSTGKRPALRHKNVYRVHDIDRGLLFVASSRYRGTLETLRQSSAFADLLAAGAVPTDAEPSLIREHLGLR